MFLNVIIITYVYKFTVVILASVTKNILHTPRKYGANPALSRNCIPDESGKPDTQGMLNVRKERSWFLPDLLYFGRYMPKLRKKLCFSLLLGSAPAVPVREGDYDFLV